MTQMSWIPSEEAIKIKEFFKELEKETVGFTMRRWKTKEQYNLYKKRKNLARNYYIAYIKVGQTTKVAAIDRVTGVAYKLSETGYYVPTWEKWKTWTLIRSFRSMDF